MLDLIAAGVIFIVASFLLMPFFPFIAIGITSFRSRTPLGEGFA